MNEMTKTSIFIGIAVVLLLFAWLVQRREHSGNDDSIIGTQLLKDFVNTVRTRVSCPVTINS